MVQQLRDAFPSELSHRFLILDNDAIFSAQVACSISGLGATAGLEMVEMHRAMGNALRCGSGGGSFFTDVLGGEADGSCRVEVREATETGTRAFAIACPKCAVMLEDAIAVEDLEDELRVMDTAGIVEERAA